MEKEVIRQIVTKIMERDYERWIQYANECIEDRKSYTKSFYFWKKDNKMMEKDIEVLVELLSS